MTNTRPAVDVHYRLTKWNRLRKLMIGQSRCACGRDWPCAQALETWVKWMRDTSTYGEP